MGEQEVQELTWGRKMRIQNISTIACRSTIQKEMTSKKII